MTGRLLTQDSQGDVGSNDGVEAVIHLTGNDPPVVLRCGSDLHLGPGYTPERLSYLDNR